MTAIVKHISVHPEFRYSRRLGVFDDLDRQANLDRHRQNKETARQKVLRNSNSAVTFQYVKKSSPLPAGPEYTESLSITPSLCGFDLGTIPEADLKAMYEIEFSHSGIVEKVKYVGLKVEDDPN